MANLRIGYINLADLATLTASPTMTSAGPVTFLQSDARGDIAQATSSASQDILGTWGGVAYTVSQLTLWRHNLLYNSTLRLILYSDTAWTTSVYDSTAFNSYASGLFDAWGWGFSNVYFSPVTGVKSFKLTVNAGFVMQASRLYLGAYIEAPVNPQEGFVLAPNSNSKQSRSESASLRSIAKPDWREATFDMMVSTESDRAIWFEISRYCQVNKSFVASLFPGVGGAQERDHTLFGKFDGKPPAMKLMTNKYDFSMKIAGL